LIFAAGLGQLGLAAASASNQGSDLLDYLASGYTLA
jgi:hypothetical protein